MERTAIEHTPDRYKGDYNGHHIRHGDPVPVVVTVEWSDGTRGQHQGVTRQWTLTHVRVLFDDLPGMYVGELRSPTTSPRAGSSWALWVLADQCQRVEAGRST